MYVLQCKRFERSNFIVEKTEHKPKSRLKTVYFKNNTIQKISNVHMIRGIQMKNNTLKMNATTCN